MHICQEEVVGMPCAGSMAMRRQADLIHTMQVGSRPHPKLPVLRESLHAAVDLLRVPQIFHGSSFNATPTPSTS